MCERDCLRCFIQFFALHIDFIFFPAGPIFYLPNIGFVYTLKRESCSSLFTFRCWDWRLLRLRLRRSGIGEEVVEGRKLRRSSRRCGCRWGSRRRRMGV